MSEREKIFADIRGALEQLPEKTAYPEWDPAITVSRHAKDEVDNIELFRIRMEAAKGVFLEGWDELIQFLRKEESTRGYVDPDLVAKYKEELKGLQCETLFNRQHIDNYNFGITQASGAIAESGTIVLRDGDSPYRLAALAPWIHVAIIHKDSIKRTVAEAVSELGPDPSIIYATGPSKTADIEGILIQGVHGPGIQVACLI